MVDEENMEIDVEAWSKKTQSWIEFMKLMVNVVSEFINTIMGLVGSLNIANLIGGGN